MHSSTDGGSNKKGLEASTGASDPLVIRCGAALDEVISALNDQHRTF